MSINVSGGVDQVGITVESDPNALKIANNLSDLNNASTARSNLGVPYATDAEAQTGVSSTKVVSPTSASYARMSPSAFRITPNVLAGSTSGTGASATFLFYSFRVVGPTSSSGYGIGSIAVVSNTRGTTGGTSGVSNPFDWSKKFKAVFRTFSGSAVTDANAIFRLMFGKTSGVNGDLTTRGVGVKNAGSGALMLQVHNGTALTEVTSSFTPVQYSWSDYRIEGDGAGTFNLYVNDSLVATTSAGPTNAGGTNGNFVVVESENIATISGSNRSQYIGEIIFEFSIA